jgi:AraC-like DNA-binding protein
MRFRVLKTYFVEILLLFTIAIMATIAMLSWFLNTHFERSTSHMVNTLNQDFLAETHRINEYLQKMVKISGMELFLEPSVQKIMYQKELTNFDAVTAIRRLDAVMSTNLHTHSIYVYNATRNYLYATSNVDSDSVDRFKDQGVLNLLNGNADHRRLAPIPRYMSTTTGIIPVYSFVFYTIQTSEPKIHGAMVMNISLDWLREVFHDNEDSASTIVFVDEEGTIAYHSDTSRFLQNISSDPIFSQMAKSSSPTGYFLHRDTTGTYFVFHSKSQDSPLYLMRIYPYEVIMAGIIDVRTTTLLLVFLCVAIALLLGVLASRRLYKPIHQLVSRVESNAKMSVYNQGELGFLSSSIDHMLTQAQTTETYRKLLQIDVLREILTGKIADPTVVEQQFKEYALPLSLNIPLMVLALKPCNETTYQAIATCVPSMISCGVPFDEDTMLVLAQDCLGTQLDLFVEQAYGKNVSLIVLKRKVEQPYRLSATAVSLLEEARFSFLYPERSLIDDRMVGRNLTGGTYPTELEKTLLHLLQQGRTKDAYNRYMEFFDHVSRNSFSHFRFSMKRFYISLQLLLKDLHETGCLADRHEMSITEFEAFIDKLDSRATLDQLFLNWFEHFEEELQRCRAQKNRALVDTIKQVIGKEYTNPNLCLQFIADAVGLSVSYVSKLFKETEGTLVSDYWLDMRMREAIRLLTTTDTPVKEIASSIGFFNENYFYTVFKKQYGTTPNEYRRLVRLQ